ncbi:MAG: sugar porter family MFS transporter [Candidatus Omnitrophica bacterium]|nr:sugar porter family MFS transporter [Candidatus Omnitrophota bacterium]MDD5652927.1 sugar porter family MFS transporter [Candidatus Omnitrophota bacterium]
MMLIIYVIAFVAALAGLLFGYDTGVISGAILFIKDQFNLTSVLVERVVSSVLLGAVIGAAFSGSMADKLGRRRSIVITALLFSLGAVGCAFSPTIPILVCFRFLIGLAIGVASYVAPLYISEISPPDVRGALVSLNQLMITCGIVVSYLVAYALTLGQNEWRWMFGLGAAPAIILLIGMIFLPESPRWLISRGLIDRARAVLAKTNKGKNPDVEIENISKTLTEKGCCWREVFQPWVRPALLVGIALAFFQQATGINTIIYYAPTIFEFAGFGSHRVAILATIGVGTVNVLMTIVAIWLLDKIGRKPLLYIGMAGMTISLAILGIAFYLPSLSGILKWIAVGSVLFYIASFAISLGPIFWLMIAEIYPLKIRGRAMSLATLANWGFNMIVAASFLTLTDKLGKAGTFWLFAVICVVGIIYSYFFVPETKGLTLEQIEEHLHSGKGLYKLGA